MCKVKVKNCSDSIDQHNKGQKHNELLKNYRVCEKCHVYVLNTPAGVRAHEESFAHCHQSRLQEEGGARDGDALAKRQRDANDANAGSVQTKDNAKKRKEKNKKPQAAGV